MKAATAISAVLLALSSRSLAKTVTCIYETRMNDKNAPCSICRIAFEKGEAKGPDCVKVLNMYGRVVLDCIKAVPAGQTNVEFAFSGGECFVTGGRWYASRPDGSSPLWDNFNCPYPSQSCSGVINLPAGMWVFGIGIDYVGGTGSKCACGWGGGGPCGGCNIGDGLACGPAGATGSLTVDFTTTYEGQEPPPQPKCSDCKTSATEYKQSNPKWATQYLDSCCAVGCTCFDTISGSGCAMTCVAMAGGITPAELNTAVTKDLGYDATGKIIMEVAVDNIGKEYCGTIYIDGKDPDSQQKVMASICNGNDVIVKIKKSEGHYHYVLVKGEENVNGKCKLVILDPATPGKKYLEEYLEGDGSIEKYIEMSPSY